MSIQVKIDNLSSEQAQNIKKDLTIRIDNGSSTKYVFPFLINETYIYSPFAYSLNNLNLKRRNRSEFSEINVKFIGILRDEQKVVKNEGLKILNETGSVLLSLRTGFGKTFLAIN